MKTILRFKIALSFLFVLPLTGQCKPLFIGDSLTYELAMSYKKIAPVDARFLESTGLKSTKILHWQNYLQHIDFSRYDTVYIVLGTNDFIQKSEIVDYQDKASVFIRTIKKENSNIVWLLPPTLKNSTKNALLNNTRQAIQRASHKENIQTLDMRKPLGGTYKASVNGVHARTQDGVHITEKGADLVINLLMEH
ncbi:GDSL-type esterase/lipase family protein [Morganella morganii]|uniref:DUF459 domain-containing protein n=1 Tax=Morganella morganii TaxID=582 RepID=UPI00313826F9